MATTQFGTNQAQNAKYHYERLVYTYGSTTLATGKSPVFSAQQWNHGGATYPEWQARLEWFAASQNADVTLKWTADPQNSRGVQNPGFTEAARASTQGQNLLIEGVQQLDLNLDNTSGSTVANWQLNYAVAMRKLLAADKLMRQQAGLSGYALTNQEMAAAVALGFGVQTGNGFAWTDKGIEGLVNKGTLPLGMDRLMDAIYKNRTLSTTEDLWYPQSSTGDNPFATYNADLSGLAKGTFPVLTGIAIEGAPNVNVTVDRDGQLGYMQVNGAAYVQANDAMWDCWVPAMSYLTFHVINNVGNSVAANVGIRLRIATLSMSEVLAILYGRITNPAEATSDSAYYKTLMGLL